MLLLELRLLFPFLLEINIKISQTDKLVLRITNN